MPKKKNSLSILTKPTSKQAGVGAISRLLAPIDLVSASEGSSGSTNSSSKVRASNDVSGYKNNGAAPSSEEINFGKPSNSATSTKQNGSEWSNLLKQTASGGVASAIGGSFGLGSIVGLGSVVSSIISLFGGHKKAPAPLAEFTLPNSINQTEYVSSTGTTVYQGSASQAAATGRVPTGIYSAGASRSGAAQRASTPPATLQAPGNGANNSWTQAQSSQIAQAVKIALLNSSSLNDVIADI